MNNRRNFLAGAGVITAAVSAAAVSRVAMAALPEPVMQTKPDTMAPLIPNTGKPYNPVVTLNGWTLPWRMNNNVKEFHLVAEPVVREFAPGYLHFNARRLGKGFERLADFAEGRPWVRGQQD